MSRNALSRSWLSEGSENDGLCNECAKLDLEQHFARAFDLYEGARRGKNTRALKVYRAGNGPPYLGHFYHVTVLGDRLSRVTHCKLCKFLKLTAVNLSKGAYKLLAICSSESYLFEAPQKDNHGRLERRPWADLEHNIFMAVVPVVPLIPKTGIPLRWFETELPKNGSIYRLTRWKSDETRLVLPRLLKPKAELDLVRFWLDLCRNTHECCAPKKPVGVSLPGFRAINCTKTPPTVEERPWSQSYVALSYVWGPPSGDWPQTILDAVEITKQLGEQYLWVDRLCINQSNLQEKQFLISKMDAIYEGAEFTIVAAAGDARAGLSGVADTPRMPQPQVELKKRSRNTTGSALLDEDPYVKLVGITEEEYEETTKDREWLDLHRFGLKSKVQLDDQYISEFSKDQEIMETYDISREHLTFFQDFAEDFGNSIDEHMIKMEQMAQRMGIAMKELVPYFLREMATQAGVPADEIEEITSAPPPRPTTEPSKKEKPLPPGQIAGRTVLISTLEDPRTTIKNSEWVTRGWTYQEGVLSNRRLVFTEKQVYWECCGMTMCESLDLPLLDLYHPSGTRMADYMLSGIFDGDLHRVPELQYGFKTSTVDEVSEQVLKLDSHIRAFTSRKLSYDNDSLNAFLGVAARYSADDGLCLLLGMPVWVGPFANGRPGLQDTFALSISAWSHTAQPVAKGAQMYVAHCPRHAQFPSWTWAGWGGRAAFSATGAAGEDEDEPTGGEDAVHVEFFRAMTSKTWVAGINLLWSAEISLHAIDGSEATLLVGRQPVARMADPGKKWLLRIREPLVMRHMHLMHSAVQGEWRRLMGKRVQLHFSVPMTEAELTAGHRTGELVTVLVFASTVPFVYNGTARYLILRKADAAGTRWVRIGQLAMALEEWEMDRFQSGAEMIAGLPVKEFGREIVVV